MMHFFQTLSAKTSPEPQGDDYPMALTIIILDDMEGNIYHVDYSAFMVKYKQQFNTTNVSVALLFLQRLCKPLPAWASTNHKFQGSQTDTVVYALSDIDDRRHIYTAATRAKKRVLLIGKLIEFWKKFIFFYLAPFTSTDLSYLQEITNIWKRPSRPQGGRE